MKAIINTFYVPTALELLKEECSTLDIQSLTHGESLIIVDFVDDMEYRAMALWIAHALGCGLITGGKIER